MTDKKTPPTPRQETYPPVPWPEDAIVRGEVMWTGKRCESHP